MGNNGVAQRGIGVVVLATYAVDYTCAAVECGACIELLHLPCGCDVSILLLDAYRKALDHYQLVRYRIPAYGVELYRSQVAVACNADSFQLNCGCSTESILAVGSVVYLQCGTRCVALAT